MGDLYEVRVKKARLGGLENRLEGLEENHKALSKQIGYTSNLAERSNLERQLAEINDEMDRVARECSQLEQQIAELAKTAGVKLPEQPGDIAGALRSLLDILAPYEAEILQHLEDAYRSARPVDWLRPMPITLKGKLVDLEDMQPDGMGYAAILKFVAHLVADAQVPQILSRRLQQWAEQRSQNFSQVLKQVRQLTTREGQGSTVDSDRCTDSYLMVVVERQNAGNKQEDRYFVKAWIILDAQNCQSQSGIGFDSLTIPGASEDAERSFTLDEICGLLKDFLIESGKKCSLPHLSIELFLPSDLLNQSVDGWIVNDESDFAVPIGVDHRIVVRSSERLREAYLIRRGGFWRKKWKSLQQLVQESAGKAFVSGDGENPNKLYQQLSKQNMIGLKLVKESLSFGKHSTFAVFQEAAIPVAIWLRQPLPTLDCSAEVDQLLNCYIHELPEVVKQKRGDALSEALDCHIGHHLALLWEDCDRLPPDLSYYMP